MHDLAKYLPLPFMKGGEYDEVNWAVLDKELSEHEIHVETRYRIPTSMQD